MSQKNASTQELRVVVVKVGEYAEITTIPRGLDSLQSIVGGSIERAYPFSDEVAVLWNEEGNLFDLPYNRELVYDDGVTTFVRGDFLIIGAPSNSEDFESLSDELAVKYRNMFLIPESFYLTPRGAVNAYFKVQGKTPLSDETLCEILQSFINDDNCTFEQMRQTCNYLVKKTHLHGTVHLYDVVNEGILNGEKVANLLKCLETFEGCNLFYYDESERNNSAYPVTDKVSLTAAILDYLPLTPEAHKQNSFLYAYCKEEAIHQLNEICELNEYEYSEADFAKLTDICAEALWNGSILNGDAISDIVVDKVAEFNRGCE